MIKTTLKRVFAWAVVLGLAVIMIRTFAQVRKDRPDRDEDEQSEEAIETPCNGLRRERPNGHHSRSQSPVPRRDHRRFS